MLKSPFCSKQRCVWPDKSVTGVTVCDIHKKVLGHIPQSATGHTVCR